MPWRTTVGPKHEQLVLLKGKSWERGCGVQDPRHMKEHLVRIRAGILELIPLLVVFVIDLPQYPGTGCLGFCKSAFCVTSDPETQKIRREIATC